jgi:uncharacterized protein (DUF1697 family)
VKYVALLRGINVGGNSKVEMAKLRQVFEALGFTNVSTYINSGNVLFSSTEPLVSSESIEKAISNTFAFFVPVLIRSQEQFMKTVESINVHWENNDIQKTDVLFLWEKFDYPEVVSTIKTTEVDRLVYTEGAIIWNVARDEYAKSGMQHFIQNPIYKNMTARNCNTVRKLAELLENA